MHGSRLHHHALAIVLALSADTSAPPPSRPPAAAASTSDSPPASLTLPPPEQQRSERAARRLRIGGYVTLALGCGLLGTMAAAAAFHRQGIARLDARVAALTPGERLDPFQRLSARQNIDSAQMDRDVAIGTGVSAALSLALATTLFILARRHDRGRSRLALAPAWLPSGAGLTFQVRLR
ncbi:MAG TPA: hypothetical protein VGB85_06920 [Nannocystis sp.]|jgi:hypothetical protein